MLIYKRNIGEFFNSLNSILKNRTVINWIELISRKDLQNFAILQIHSYFSKSISAMQDFTNSKNVVLLESKKRFLNFMFSFFFIWKEIRNFFKIKIACFSKSSWNMSISPSLSRIKKKKLIQPFLFYQKGYERIVCFSTMYKK